MTATRPRGDALRQPPGSPSSAALLIEEADADPPWDAAVQDPGLQQSKLADAELGHARSVYVPSPTTSSSLPSSAGSCREWPGNKRTVRLQVADNFVEHDHDASKGLGPSDLPSLFAHAPPVGRRVALRTVPLAGQESLDMDAATGNFRGPRAAMEHGQPDDGSGLSLAEQPVDGQLEQKPLEKTRSLRVNIGGSEVEHRHDTSTGFGPRDLPRMFNSVAPVGRRITLRTVPFGVAPSAAGDSVANPLAGVDSVQVLGSPSSSAAFLPSLLPAAAQLSADARGNELVTKGRHRYRTAAIVVLASVLVFMLFGAFAVASLLMIGKTLFGNWTTQGSLTVSQTVAADRVTATSGLVAAGWALTDSAIAAGSQPVLSVDAQSSRVSFQGNTLVVGGGAVINNPLVFSASSAASAAVATASLEEIAVASRSVQIDSSQIWLSPTEGIIVDSRMSPSTPNVNVVPGPGGKIVLYGDLCFAQPFPSNQTTFSQAELTLSGFNASTVDCGSFATLSNFLNLSALALNISASYSGSVVGPNWPYSTLHVTAAGNFSMSTVSGAIGLAPASGVVTIRASVVELDSTGPVATQIQSSTPVGFSQGASFGGSVIVAGGLTAATAVTAPRIVSPSAGVDLTLSSLSGTILLDSPVLDFTFFSPHINASGTISFSTGASFAGSMSALDSVLAGRFVSTPLVLSPTGVDLSLTSGSGTVVIGSPVVDLTYVSPHINASGTISFSTGASFASGVDVTGGISASTSVTTPHVTSPAGSDLSLGAASGTLQVEPSVLDFVGTSPKINASGGTLTLTPAVNFAGFTSFSNNVSVQTQLSTSILQATQVYTGYVGSDALNPYLIMDATSLTSFSTNLVDLKASELRLTSLSLHSSAVIQSTAGSLLLEDSSNAYSLSLAAASSSLLSSSLVVQQPSAGPTLTLTPSSAAQSTLATSSAALHLATGSTAQVFVAAASVNVSGTTQLQVEDTSSNSLVLGATASTVTSSQSTVTVVSSTASLAVTSAGLFTGISFTAKDSTGPPHSTLTLTPSSGVISSSQSVTVQSGSGDVIVAPSSGIVSSSSAYLVTSSHPQGLGISSSAADLRLYSAAGVISALADTVLWNVSASTMLTHQTTGTTWVMQVSGGTGTMVVGAAQLRMSSMYLQSSVGNLTLDVAGGSLVSPNVRNIVFGDSLNGLSVYSTGGPVSLVANNGLFSLSSLQDNLALSSGQDILLAGRHVNVSSSSTYLQASNYAGHPGSNVFMQSNLNFSVYAPYGDFFLRTGGNINLAPASSVVMSSGTSMIVSSIAAIGSQNLVINSGGTGTYVQFTSPYVMVGSLLQLYTSGDLQSAGMGTTGNAMLHLSSGSGNMTFVSSSTFNLWTASSGGSWIQFDAGNQRLYSSSSSLSVFQNSLFLQQDSTSSQTLLRSSDPYGFNFDVSSANGYFYFGGGQEQINLANGLLLDGSRNMISTNATILRLQAQNASAIIQPQSIVWLERTVIHPAIQWNDASDTTGGKHWSLLIDNDGDFSACLYSVSSAQWIIQTSSFRNGDFFLLGSLQGPSSRRIKQKIADIAGPTALELVSRTQAVQFEVVGGDDGNRTHFGYIAEELALAIPQVTHRTNVTDQPLDELVQNRDSLLPAIAREKALRDIDSQKVHVRRESHSLKRDVPGVSLTSMVPLLSESIKALKGMVEDLQVSVLELQAENHQLRQQLEAIAARTGGR